MIKLIKGIKNIIENYEIFIIDQWGVMHNGKKGYNKAIDCVNYLKKNNKKLIIISNSSKRNTSSIERLPSLGFEKNNFDKVITSGEMIWKELSFSLNLYGEKLINCYHIFDNSKENGKDFRKGLQHIKFVEEIDNADFILACTPFNNSKPIDYIPLLKKAFDKNLILFCANPDFETIENSENKNIFCMGTIAQLYEKIGGKVVIKGKPDQQIYKEALSDISYNKSKIVAIGDSLFHDIKGAQNFGVDSVLITSGIHKDLFASKSIDTDVAKNIINKYKIQPSFLCDSFEI